MLIEGGAPQGRVVSDLKKLIRTITGIIGTHSTKMVVMSPAVSENFQIIQTDALRELLL